MNPCTARSIPVVHKHIDPFFPRTFVIFILFTLLSHLGGKKGQSFFPIERIVIIIMSYFVLLTLQKSNISLELSLFNQVWGVRREHREVNQPKFVNEGQVWEEIKLTLNCAEHYNKKTQLIFYVFWEFLENLFLLLAYFHICWPIIKIV